MKSNFRQNNSRFSLFRKNEKDENREEVERREKSSLGRINL